LSIVYLGHGVSGGLSNTACDPAKLARFALPQLETPEQIAQAMAITVPALRFLAFSRTTSEVTHYVRFEIPRKTGGTRRISGPMPRLKHAQRWLLDNLLDKVALHDAAHGFRKQRSIVSNARPHVGADVVLNLDLKDFFPTLEYKRIRGAFRGLGYGEAAATIFALLTSEPEVDEVELDGQTFYVANGARRLPQGAPTSPAITNVVCRRMDACLAGAAAKLGFTYTQARLAAQEAPAAEVARWTGWWRSSIGAPAVAAVARAHVPPSRGRRSRRRRRSGGRCSDSSAAEGSNHGHDFDACLLKRDERERHLKARVGALGGEPGRRWSAQCDLEAAVQDRRYVR
jgi:hypothetical protein